MAVAGKLRARYRPYGAGRFLFSFQTGCSMIRLSLRVAAFCAGAFLLFAAVPARADEAAGLLAKHKAFVGWQLGDGTIKTLRFEQTTANSTGDVTETAQIVRAGVAYRATRVGKKGLVREDGFTGRIFWESNENGFTRPAIGNPQKYAIARDVLHMEATSELTGTSQTSKTIDGISYPVVRVDTPGDRIDLYVDPQTGAYKRAVIDPGGDYETVIDILAYSEIAPGKKMISKYQVRDTNSIYERSKFVVNGPVADDDLHPPKQTAVWNFANAQPFPIKVTDKRIMVDARVNGVPGRFILDTGADGIVLTDAFAGRAHVKEITNSAARGIGGGTKTLIRKADTIEVGGNTLSNVIVSSLNEQMDADAPDGLLGFDLLAAAVVDLNTDSQQMSISDPASTTIDKASGVPALVDLANGTPTLPMKLNGRIDVNATLDSGDFYYVLFSPDLIKKQGLIMLVDPSEIGYFQSHVAIAGVGGYELDGCGHLESLTLGPIVYQGPPACSSGSFGGRDTLLGFDFVRNFNYIFDYPESTIVFIPHKS